jgi:hypothetical protein
MALEVGTAVEADYKHRGKFYPGKITRVRLNGTYDIDYDDGEQETQVPRDLIIKTKPRYLGKIRVNEICSLTGFVAEGSRNWMKMMPLRLALLSKQTTRAKASCILERSPESD